MRLSKRGDSVALEVAIWWDKKGSTINLASNHDPEAKTFHVRVSADASKATVHPALYNELVKCLRAKGAPTPPPAEPSK